MTEKIIIAGSGGQGVQTLGLLIAKTGTFENKKVTWLPSYGAEKRGGFSFCHVIISDNQIYTPQCDKPDTLILFDQRAYNNFSSKVSPDTLVIENSSLIKNSNFKLRKKIAVPATDIANTLSFSAATNIVLAGVYFTVKSIYQIQSVINVIKDFFNQKSNGLLKKNIKAFSEGNNFLKQNYSEYFSEIDYEEVNTVINESLAFS